MEQTLSLESDRFSASQEIFKRFPVVILARMPINLPRGFSGFFRLLLGRKFNPLNAELNPICHLLALLGTHHILHVSRVKFCHNFFLTHHSHEWITTGYSTTVQFDSSAAIFTDDM
jgi:hypothetical protein